jgi:N-acetylglutamate synthase-like GNAT family acetyltransferase
MIRKCSSSDFKQLYFIINKAATAYDGTIPADCYRQPYMPQHELKQEMQRMTFFGWEDQSQLAGVMALEPVNDVSLIRHAYVLPDWQGHGVGSILLRYILSQTVASRILVGTWADATWAVNFYQKHGFVLRTDKDNLLKTYWNISERQIETSVVLELNKRD